MSLKQYCRRIFKIVNCYFSKEISSLTNENEDLKAKIVDQEQIITYYEELRKDEASGIHQRPQASPGTGSVEATVGQKPAR